MRLPGIQFSNEQLQISRRNLPSIQRAGAAFGDIARLSGAFAEQKIQALEREQETEAIATLSNFELEEQQRMEDFKVKRQQNPTGFAKDYLEKFDKAYDKAIPKEASKHQREIFERQKLSVRNNVARRAMSFEATQKVAVQKERLQMAGENLLNIVQRDPSRINEEIAKVELLYDTASSQVLLPNARFAKQDLIKRMHGTVVDSYLSDERTEDAQQYVQNNAEAFGGDLSRVNDEIKRVKKVASEKKLYLKTQGEDGLLETLVYNDKIPVKERVRQLRKLALEEKVKKGFASSAVSYLKTLDDTTQKKTKRYTNAEKYLALEEKAQKLRQLRVDLGGEPDALEQVVLTPENIQLYESYRDEVLADERLSEAEIKNFLAPAQEAFGNAITNLENSGSFVFDMFSGIQTPDDEAIDAIHKYHETIGRSSDVSSKLRMYKLFKENLGDYTSSGDNAKDRQRISEAVSKSIKQSNAQNYLGIIDAENPPNMVVRKLPSAPPIGTVKNGYRYVGGDPSQQTSWEKVE